MQRLDHFAVNAAGPDVLFAPNLLSLLRRAPGRDNLAALLTELRNVKISQFVCNFFGSASLDLDIIIASHHPQFRHIADAVSFGFANCSCLQQESHIAAMIAVSRKTCRNRARQVTRLNSIQRRAADTRFTALGQSAWTHSALLAAHSCAADIARNHGICAGKGCPNSQLLCADQHLLRGWVGRVIFDFTFLWHDSPLFFMSLRGGCSSRRSNLLIELGIASSRRARALLAMTLFFYLHRPHAWAGPERASVVVHTLGKGNCPFDGFIHGCMAEEMIPAYFFDRNTRLDQHRHFAEIASLFKTCGNLFSVDLCRIIFNFDNLKSAACIYFADPRQLEQYSPHLGNMMVSVKRRRFERFDLHRTPLIKRWM